MIMGDIKAAFFDIDGTLTSFTTHTVPQSAITAIQQAQQRGVRVFLCTGRAACHLSVVLPSIPIHFDGIIAMNGQYCFTDSEVIATGPLDQSDVHRICTWLDEHPSVVASFSESNYVYVNKINESMNSARSKLGNTAATLGIDDYHRRPLERDTFQISPYIDEDLERDLLACLEHTQAVRWHSDFVDLIPTTGGKPVGMRHFLTHFGIEDSPCIAFGDGGNDITMLEFATIGVAMGNASDEVKSHADYVTDSVDDHGIMHALQHFGVIAI